MVFALMKVRTKLVISTMGNSGRKSVMGGEVHVDKLQKVKEANDDKLQKEKEEVDKGKLQKEKEDTAVDKLQKEEEADDNKIQKEEGVVFLK